MSALPDHAVVAGLLRAGRRAYADGNLKNCLEEPCIVRFSLPQA
jgi:hypothetical protein